MHDDDNEDIAKATSIPWVFSENSQAEKLAIEKILFVLQPTELGDKMVVGYAENINIENLLSLHMPDVD